MHRVLSRRASTLVVASHNDRALDAGTRNAVSAAAKLGEISLLVAGQGVGGVAKDAAKIT